MYQPLAYFLAFCWCENRTEELIQTLTNITNNKLPLCLHER